jgi:tRNA(fMet)-specific endonuclease VapC
VSLPLENLAARVFGQIRRSLELAGQAIGPYDTMIGAIALVHNLILVTHNTAEFSRINGISLEDWQIP